MASRHSAGNILARYETEKAKIAPESVIDIIDVRNQLDEDHIERLELAYAAAKMDGTIMPPPPVIIRCSRSKLPVSALRGIRTNDQTFWAWVDGRHRGDSWSRLYGPEEQMDVIVIRTPLNWCETLGLATRLNQATNQLPMSMDEVRDVIKRLLDQKQTLSGIEELLVSPALPAATIRKLYPTTRKDWLKDRCKVAYEDIKRGSSMRTAAKSASITESQLRQYLDGLARKDNGTGPASQLLLRFERTHKDFGRLRAHIGGAWGWSRGKDAVLGGTASADQWSAVLDDLLRETEQIRKIVIDHMTKFSEWRCEENTAI